MKIYDFDAPNAQRVRIFAAEKGLALDFVSVDVIGHALRTPEMRRKNPLMTVPFAELEDGTTIRESLAIMVYLEGLHPEPPLFGRTPLEKARVIEADRLADLGIMNELANYAHNISPFFADRGPQSAAAAEMALNGYRKYLDIQNMVLASRPYAAGDFVSAADCTLYAVLDFADKVGQSPSAALEHLADWRARFGARPSAKA